MEEPQVFSVLNIMKNKFRDKFQTKLEFLKKANLCSSFKIFMYFLLH